MRLLPITMDPGRPTLLASGLSLKSSLGCLQDKNSDNKAAAEAKFKEVSEAYEVGWRRAGSHVQWQL
jgi:hypothetical protein